MQIGTGLSVFAQRRVVGGPRAAYQIRTMRQLFTLSILTIALAMTTSGCDNTSSSAVYMVVQSAAWLPNESGMIALAQKQTVSAVDNSVSLTRGLYSVGADGSIGSVIGPGEVGEANWNSPVLFVSKDGGTAYAQIGAHIYRVNLGDNSATQVIQNAALLGVSPDGRYAISTNAAETDKAPDYIMYDVATSPVRLVRHFTPPNIYNSRCLWIDNGTFALTSTDSVGVYVTLWDTTCTILHTYPDADARFSAAAYSPTSHDLFVRTNTGGIDRINMLTQVRASVITQDTVESVGASADGTLLAYSSGRTTQQLPLYSCNTQNGHTAVIGSDAVFPIISPNADRVAFVHNASPNVDIKVNGISLPQ